MKNFIFFIFSLILLISCMPSNKEEDVEATSDNMVMKEYHSNGKIKSEIAILGDIRQGLTKNYNREGRLLSQVNYVNNKKEGTAVNYYVATGNINSSLEYKDGIKNGDEKWFYESGQVYRVSPYVGGIIEGIQQLYYENGKIMAEVPYKNGFPGTGLKEYKPDGTLVSDYPHIIIKEEDHRVDANRMLLIIKLSDNARGVKFYKGALTEGRYLNKNLLTLATQEGMTQIGFNVPPGAIVKESIVITANFKTKMGNPLILKKTYNFR